MTTGTPEELTSIAKLLSAIKSENLETQRLIDQTRVALYEEASAGLRRHAVTKQLVAVLQDGRVLASRDGLSFSDIAVRM